MAGAMFDMVLDVGSPYTLAACVDCTGSGYASSVRGGNWYDLANFKFRAAWRHAKIELDVPNPRSTATGLRCARSP